MPLTAVQNVLVKADILANPDLNANPNTLDGAAAIAKLYNLPANPAYAVWRTDAQVSAIFDAITWSAYTPVDAVDATALFSNRCYVINIKQMNLQNILLGRESINATLPNVRAGLRDAVTAIPAGTLGVMVTAGGTGGSAVLLACQRNARRIERLLTTGTATTGTTTGGLMGFEGEVTYDDINTARNS